MASFADNEMNVNITCLHILYFGISEDSSPSLVCWPTNKRFWLPELLQSTCKIVIAIAEQCANDTQGCIVPFLILLFVCCLLFVHLGEGVVLRLGVSSIIIVFGWGVDWVISINLYRQPTHLFHITAFVNVCHCVILIIKPEHNGPY